MKLRTYFAGLIVLFAVAALAGVFYVRGQSRQNARSQALQEATFAASSASKVIGEGARILQGALDGLAGNPQLPAVLAHPSQCALSWGQVGAFPSGHLDILASDGRVVCSSGARRGSYAGQPWLLPARSAPQVIAPARDPMTGQPVALFTAPLKGSIVVAFVDLDPVGPNLVEQLAGPKGLRYLVTTSDGRRVLARSNHPARYVGTSIVRTAFFQQQPVARPRRPGRHRQAVRQCDRARSRLAGLCRPAGERRAVVGRHPV